MSSSRTNANETPRAQEKRQRVSSSPSGIEESASQDAPVQAPSNTTRPRRGQPVPKRSKSGNAESSQDPNDAINYHPGHQVAMQNPAAGGGPSTGIAAFNSSVFDYFEGQQILLPDPGPVEGGELGLGPITGGGLSSFPGQDFGFQQVQPAYLELGDGAVFQDFGEPYYYGNTGSGSTYANYSPGLVGNVQGVVASDSDTVLVQTGFNGVAALDDEFFQGGSYMELATGTGNIPVAVGPALAQNQWQMAPFSNLGNYQQVQGNFNEPFTNPTDQGETSSQSHPHGNFGYAATSDAPTLVTQDSNMEGFKELPFDRQVQILNDESKSDDKLQSIYGLNRQDGRDTRGTHELMRSLRARGERFLKARNEYFNRRVWVEFPSSASRNPAAEVAIQPNGKIRALEVYNGIQIKGSLRGTILKRGVIVPEWILPTWNGFRNWEIREMDVHSFVLENMLKVYDAGTEVKDKDGKSVSEKRLGFQCPFKHYDFEKNERCKNPAIHFLESKKKFHPKRYDLPAEYQQLAANFNQASAGGLDVTSTGLGNSLQGFILPRSKAVQTVGNIIRLHLRDAHGVPLDWIRSYGDKID